MDPVRVLEIETLLRLYSRLTPHHRAMVQDLARELGHWEDQHPERYSPPPFELPE